MEERVVGRRRVSEILDIWKMIWNDLQARYTPHYQKLAKKGAKMYKVSVEEFICAANYAIPGVRGVEYFADSEMEMFDPDKEMLWQVAKDFHEGICELGD